MNATTKEREKINTNTKYFAYEQLPNGITLRQKKTIETNKKKKKKNKKKQ